METFIEEWTGRDRRELYENALTNGGNIRFGLKFEILEEIALMAEDMIDDIDRGIDPGFLPVTERERPDGGTGKIRRIACLDLRHQLLGHIVKLALEPLLNGMILPSQHASIPGHGQTGLARQTQRMLLKKKLGIRYYVKTDGCSAYASINYDTCIRLIEKEIPKAKLIIKCLRVLEKYAPGGHLIIGGYLDAWLFNFAMSYIMRYALSLYNVRRGKKIPMVIRIESYMDDVALYGKDRGALKSATKMMFRFAWQMFGMRMRCTTVVIRLPTVGEEKTLKAKTRQSERHGASIDMAGYRISRTHVRIRRRNLLKILRCFRRAWNEIQKIGTIKRQRACQLIARNGYVQTSNSRKLIEKYHVVEIMRMARRIQGYWARVENRKRKERMQNVVNQFRIQRATLPGCA